MTETNKDRDDLERIGDELELKIRLASMQRGSWAGCGGAGFPCTPDSARHLLVRAA
jgi:hypothetical protein